MPASRKHVPVLLTQAQRKAIAILLPNITERLKLDQKYQRAVRFSLAELEDIGRKAKVASRHAKGGIVRNSMLCVVDHMAQALERCQGIEAIPASERLYQFKITLLETRSPIWRRIQVKNCTLDKLHEHIQTSMGWTNSHLHQFKIDGQLYGDPMLMEKNMELMNYKDSTTTRISNILPKTGKRFRFEYEYDFGDGWQHEILFEGCLRAEQGKRYPVCIEGARACPPEDVGGVWGYQGFLEAIADPEHEEHNQFLNWVGGAFDPEVFDPVMATREMWRGIFDWRSELR